MDCKKTEYRKRSHVSICDAAYDSPSCESSLEKIRFSQIRRNKGINSPDLD
jgi:hypothetical protein